VLAGNWSYFSIGYFLYDKNGYFLVSADVDRHQRSIFGIDYHNTTDIKDHVCGVMSADLS
jgi:hypothetical protein